MPAGGENKKEKKQKRMKNNEWRRRLPSFFSPPRHAANGVSGEVCLCDSPSPVENAKSAWSAQDVAPAQLLKDPSAQQMLPVTTLQVATSPREGRSL